MRKYHKSKLLHFVFLKSLNVVILLSFLLAILLTGIVALIFNLQGRFANQQEITLSILALVNVFLIASPLVLFILCIASSLVFSVDLSKDKASINKLSRFESLLKAKVVCLEKDNVIVDGSLVIKKVIPLKTVATEQYIDQWLSNTLRATNNKGPIFEALNKQFDLELSAGVIKALCFNDETKYTGASFKGGKTIVLGNPEFVPIKNKVGILKRCEEDINKGCHILVMAEGKEQISDDGYHNELEGIALIILKDHICEDAFETLKWFEESNIDIKVISSDNALISSVNAAEAGIKNADKYVSTQGMENENIDALVSQYTLFGDTTDEQKAVIIDTYKKEQTVMMIGGNKSDVLAMKASDFAIATTNSDSISQKAADVVIESSSFKSLPQVIEKSKAFMGNMQKMLSMFLIKTVLAFVTIILFAIFSNNLKQCLFVFNHLLLWDLIINGVASFLLIFNKKNIQSNSTFFFSALKSAIPATILQIFGALTVFVLFYMQNNKLLSVGLFSINEVAVACVLLFTIFGIVSLFNVCIPFNRNRKIALIVGGSINIVAIALIMLISYLDNSGTSPYQIMNAPAYFMIAIIAVLFSSIYLFTNRIIGIVKGDNL